MASGDCSRSLADLSNQSKKIQDADLAIGRHPAATVTGGSSCPETIRAPTNPSLEEVELEAAKYWDAGVIHVDESNKAFIERSLELSRQIQKYSNNCSRRVRELNASLPEDQQFCPINIRPRDRKLLTMTLEPVYKEFHMDVTSPTTWGCKRFANPKPSENYAASTMLQVFSLRFAGDFLDDQQLLPIYGFVAVRDDCEPLRNYIFNRAREDAFNLCPDSPLLPLTSPIRGMSVWINAMVETSLKVKRNGSTCNDDDDVLFDVCIDFRWDRIKRSKKLKSRIDCSFGALVMEYMFIKRGIEAVVEVDIPLELLDDHVVIIARSSWFNHELTLYDAVVEADNARVSAMLVASRRGSLCFGYLAIGAGASGCTTVKVAKQGSYKGHVVLALGSNAAGSVTRKTCVVPFTVTFSTMGYYNNGS